MKKICLISLLLSFSLILSAQSTTLKVLTFNLRFGERASVEQLANYIKEINPDIVALQEVDYKTQRKRAPHQNGIDMIGQLAANTGMLSLYGKTINHANGYYGIAILSKYPIVKSERILLPNPQPVSEQRGLLVSEILLDNGKTFQFAVIHLDLKAEKQILQLKELNKVLLKDKLPTILAGDFNLTPADEILTKGMKNWKDALPNELTFPSEKPTHKIDYIFLRNKDNVKVTESAVLKDCNLSDHFPGYAILEINL